MLRLARSAFDDLVAQAYRCYPEEACGLIAGPVVSGAAADGAGDGAAGSVDAEAVVFYPCRNAAQSARVYTIDPLDHLRAEQDADDRDWQINGVVHSHTHSEPYPSPTDVAQAPDSSWHYVIVSLKRDVPEVRSYRIVDGEISEEEIALT